MDRLGLTRAYETASGASLLWWALWIGLVLVTVVLLIMMRTRWGQSNPLRKCVVLSIFAHLLLAGYATTIQIVQSTSLADHEPTIRIAAVDGFDEEPLQPSSRRPQPWDVPREPIPADLTQRAPQRAEVPRHAHGEVRTPSDIGPLDDDVPIAATPLATVALPEPATPTHEDMAREVQPAEAAEAPEAPIAEKQEPAAEPLPQTAELARPHGPFADKVDPGPSLSDALPSSLLEQPSLPPRLAEVPNKPAPDAALPDRIDAPTKPQPHEQDQTDTEKAGGTDGADELAGEPDKAATGSSDEAAANASLGDRRPASLDELHEGGGRLTPVVRPEGHEPAAPYEHRLATDRLRQAEIYGGNAEGEAAVEAALRWLARVQSADGRWDARRHGAGREQRVAGHDRGGAGADADSGVTGLALLAFLGAGYTHDQGPYRQVVANGLDFLIRGQGADGNLGHGASTFAKMYCHGMATLALSEALAMTGDERLRRPVQRAVTYTLAAQHPATGGWRYRPGDLGDTSQLGWQLMALKSAEFAGIPMPASAREGMVRYLKSVSSGQHGGLASYRPREPATRTMTAEALVCRQFLGMQRTNPASAEAADFVLGELPAAGAANFYYWYYATLGMFQLQGPHWQRWNETLQSALIASQQSDGELAGSWEPDPVWGGYGGRIYSTALGALCLEVYYRYLPLYGETANAGRMQR